MVDIINSDIKEPHTDVSSCSKCRKKFEEGHRIVQVFIFARSGRDPKNIHRTGVHIKEEFEFAHANCHDPYLRKGSS